MTGYGRVCTLAKGTVARLPAKEQLTRTKAAAPGIAVSSRSPRTRPRDSVRPDDRLYGMGRATTAGATSPDSVPTWNIRQREATKSLLRITKNGFCLTQAEGELQSTGEGHCSAGMLGSRR